MKSDSDGIMSAMKDDHGPVAPGDELFKLVTTRPEAEIAADIKAQLEKAFNPVCALCDEAARSGFSVQWDNLMLGPTMKFRVNGLRLTKSY